MAFVQLYLLLVVWLSTTISDASVETSSSPRRLKLVLDLDAGCDDAIALFLAFASDRFDVLGITTVYGNSDIHNTTANAANLLRMIQFNAYSDGSRSAEICTGTVPVYKGAAVPWSGTPFPPRTAVHGNNGLGNVVLPNVPVPAICEQRQCCSERDMSAAEFIVDICRRFPGEVSFLFAGPLTNLADALFLDPDLPSKWAKVSIMGGTFFPKRSMPRSDANFRADPESAEFVFRRVRDVLVVGMDVTLACPFTDADLEIIKAAHSNGRMLSDIFAYYHRYYAKTHPELHGTPPHDAIALLAFIRPELYQWTSASISVITKGDQRGRGFTHPGRPTNHIAISGNFSAIRQTIRDTIQNPRRQLGRQRHGLVS